MILLNWGLLQECKQIFLQNRQVTKNINITVIYNEFVNSVSSSYYKETITAQTIAEN